MAKPERGAGMGTRGERGERDERERDARAGKRRRRGDGDGDGVRRAGSDGRGVRARAGRVRRDGGARGELESGRRVRRRVRRGVRRADESAELSRGGIGGVRREVFERRRVVREFELRQVFQHGVDAGVLRRHRVVRVSQDAIGVVSVFA